MMANKLNTVSQYPHIIPAPGDQADSIKKPFNNLTQAVFYFFLFSLPFEAALVSAGFFGSDSSQSFWSLSRVTGLILIITFSLLQGVRAKWLPSVWGFAVYAILYVILAIGFLFAFNLPISFAMFSLPWLIIHFVVCYEIFLDPVTRNRGVKVLMIAIGACALLQLSNHAFNSYDLMTYDSTYLRTAAFGNDPNLIGAQYLVGIFLAIFISLDIIPGGKIIKIIAVAVAGCCMIALVQSGSRGAVISGGFAFLPFLLTKKPIKKRLAIWITVLFVVVMAIILLVNNEGFKQRFINTFTYGDTAMRTEIYQTSYRLFLASPWVGYGPERNLFALGSALGRTYTDTHNVLLWVLTANGLIGFIPFIFSLGACLYQAYRARNGPDDIAPLVLCTLVIAFSQTVTWQTEKLFWVLLAFAASATVFKVNQNNFRK